MSKKVKVASNKLALNTLRVLPIDMTNNAKSGHPGIALGAAPIVYTLYKNHLISNPKEPKWINRDRFVLSAGHGSSMLYAILHLAGYDLSLDDLKNFRQLGSKTPGHPEYGYSDGVDATTGPLAQGLAQAVGMALAEQAVQAQYEEGHELVNHYTYCLVGDGCLSEGLSQEAISLAGHQRLNKLIVFYDANNITLDGDLDLSFSENVELRFLASNWNVIKVKDGNNLGAINRAIKKAKKSKDYPTLIIVSTVIGYGSPLQGTAKVHGSPLGKEDGEKTKAFLKHNYPEFSVAEEVYELFRQTFVARGELAYKAWQDNLKVYANKHQKDYEVFLDASNRDVNKYLVKEYVKPEVGKSLATRSASGLILNDLHEQVPFIMGGSADVASSVMTKINKGTNFSPLNRGGRNLNFGVREFAMAKIQNGMLLHGGLVTYAGSFLIFSDYLKSGVRAAAYSHLPAIYLFSHDSPLLGEDGLTHQPIEQLATLRSIPNLNVLRPCDYTETYGAWTIALESKETPTALILSRQGLKEQANSDRHLVAKGAYIISKEVKELMATIIATGSEVDLALEAQALLLEKHIDVRVVSMPSMNLFLKQTSRYQNNTIGVSKDKVVAVEILSTFGWHRFAETVMGVDQFGVSAPMNDVIKHFKFTAKRLASLVEKVAKKD